MTKVHSVRVTKQDFQKFGVNNESKCKTCSIPINNLSEFYLRPEDCNVFALCGHCAFNNASTESKQMTKLKKVKMHSYEGQKRQYFPYVITDNCEKCRKEISTDFRDDYISCPEFGKVEKIPLYCDDCKTEKEIEVIPRLTLELVK